MTPDSRAAAGGVPVWDLAVRVIHWSLVACVLLDSFVLEAGELPHQVAGWLATGLVLSRVVWGFIGSRHARFSSFFPRPSAVRAQWRMLRHGRSEAHDGHSPLGALMMLALMALVLALGTTGFMQTLDAFWGESWLMDLHALAGDVLVGLATTHAAAAVVMSRLEHTNLVRAMITGVKVRR